MQATSLHFLFLQISQGHKEAFDQLFYRYYERLVDFAMQYVKQPEPAEELVSSLFVNIWRKRDQLAAVRSPQVYLFVAARNGCLNYLRRPAKQAQPLPHHPESLSRDTGNTLDTEYKELEAIVRIAVEKLPEQRRVIFRLIKEEGMKAKDVAAILSLSVRTVENQLYKALKSLAAAVSGYLGYHPQGKPLKGKTFLLFF